MKCYKKQNWDDNEIWENESPKKHLISQNPKHIIC